MGRATGRRVMGRIGGTVRNLSRGGVLLAAGVLGLAVVLADAGLAFAAVPSWSVVSSANASSESSSTTQSNLFHRVSCSSSSTCIATGRYGVRQTLAGGYSVNSSGFGSWSQVLPSDELGKNSSYVDNSLHATSCSSSSNCWSVGYYYDTSLSSYQVFAWNSNSSGSKTNQVLDSFGNEPSGDGFFYGVSCVYSVDFCPAVGYYMDSSGVAQTLIGYPSATSPVIGSSPNAGSGNNYLYGVSCTSTSFCEAVGNYVDSSGVAQTLVEEYNGSSWSIASSPNSGSGNNYLYGVSCTSTSFCAAVGYYIDSAGVAQTLADTYDGSAWTASASTNTSSSQTNYLYGVSCVSASFCASAGYWSQDPLTLSSATMAEIYNGSSWSSPSGLSSSSQPVNGNRLFGVACVSSSSCLTVGRYSMAFSLVESYTPTSWSLGSPAQITTQSDLYGISCKSSTFCVAVGDYYDSSNVQQMLIETYNGTSWSEVTGLSNPANSAGENALDGVSCASSTSCVAVGSYLESTTSGTQTQTQTQTLAVVYNGSSWTTVTPANQGSYGDTLFDISCTTSTSCVAVGMYFASLSPPTESVLTEYYNGSSWSSNSPTSPSTAGSMLMGISCASSTSCEAVGNYVDSSGVEQALVEAYNGSSWSEQTSVDSGSGQNALTDVSCVSSNFCMATGEYAADTITGVTGTLTEEYNGSSWSIVSSPDVGSGNNVLYGVSCASSTSCSGLGYEANSSAFTTNFSSATQIPQTLAEEWS